MGSGTRVDLGALRAVADQFEASASALDGAVHAHLRFDGATAGRDYVAQGDAVRTALNRLVDGLAQWARASAEIAAELRASADRYARAEDRNTVRFG